MVYNFGQKKILISVICTEGESSDAARDQGYFKFFYFYQVESNKNWPLCDSPVHGTTISEFIDISLVSKTNIIVFCVVFCYKKSSVF